MLSAAFSPASVVFYHESREQDGEMAQKWADDQIGFPPSEGRSPNHEETLRGSEAKKALTNSALNGLKQGDQRGQQRAGPSDCG